MDAISLIKELFNYGVPTAILACTVYIIWRFSNWAREKIVEPVTKAHLDLIEALREHIPKQSDAIDGMADSMKTQVAKQGETLKAIEDQTKLLQHLADRNMDAGNKVCRYPEGA